MTDRQKFWLKVVLTVTVPLWVPVAVVGWMIYGLGCMCWELATSIVEPRRSRGLGGGR